MSDIIAICFLCVFIIDLSGFIQAVEEIISRFIKPYQFHIPRPFSCSLCMTWWVCVIVGLCRGENLWWFVFSGFTAVMTPVIAGLIQKIIDYLRTKIGL